MLTLCDLVPSVLWGLGVREHEQVTGKESPLLRNTFSLQFHNRRFL